MRETIDFGIDLGTTNSAIAVAEDDGVRIIKNLEGWDYTPSAVWIPKQGMIRVGRPAKDRAGTDPKNACAEFKQQMGTASARHDFKRSGMSLTPEQLSAEVLKSLRQDAAHDLGEQPEAAVITVPASFTLNQNNATSAAAALAGLGERCPLVQEPTAAAIAYGVQDVSDAAHWMVFDLGGGTFDAAVMSKQDGELQLLQHAGDPGLGGKLIDWAIVEDLLAPAAARALGLSDFTRANPRWEVNMARLKSAAEEAKIALSRRASFDMTLDLDDGRGGTESFEYALTRGALDDLALPFYSRAIGLCRAALAESGLRPDHVDRLLLVGGATLAPGLRELLDDPVEGLGIATDHSQDPTTVVARGAAVFARNVRTPAKPRKAAPGAFTVELHYKPQVVETTDIPVSGRLSSGSPIDDWTQYGVTLSNPQARLPYQGARTALSADGAFYTEVSIDANATSRFTVELTDAAGTRQQLTPDSLSLTHAKLLPGDAVLTGTLGLGRADGSFSPVLRKGTALPATVTRTYRTSIALRRSQPDAVIRIPLLEGERRRAERNTRVGMIEIRPKDVRIDLPAQSEVEMTFEVHPDSRIVTVTADIPLVQEQFEATINRTELVAPEHGELVDRLHELEQRVRELRERADEVHSEQALARLDELDGQKALPQLRKQVDAAAVDAGEASTGDRRIRDLEAQLDDVEEAIEVPRLQHELWDHLNACEDLIAEHGNGSSERRELESLRARAGAVAEEGTSGDLHALGERVQDFRVELLRRSDQWDVLVFHALVEVRDDMLSPVQADAAIADGRRAMAAGDRQALAAVNRRLRRLLPPGLADENLIGGLQ